MDTLTVGHPVFQGFSLSILNADIYDMRLEGILAPSPVDITCASPSERAKGNAATTMMPQTATATSGSQIAMAHDTTTISQNGMRIRDGQEKGVHETACFFLSMPIGDENEIDTMAPSFLYSTCKKVKQLD